MTAPEPLTDMRSAGIATRALAALIDLGVVLLLLGALYAGLILVRLVYSNESGTLRSYPRFDVRFARPEVLRM